MLTLVGAIAFLVPYGQDAFPDVPAFPSEQFVRMVNAMEPDFSEGIKGAQIPDRWFHARRINSYLQQAESALNYLDTDQPRPSWEIPSRKAAESYSFLRRFVGNRVAIQRFVPMPDLLRQAAQLGVDPAWWFSTLDEVTARCMSPRISDFMGADQATMKWARPEIRRLLTALHQSPYPSTRLGNEDSKSTWEVAAEINLCLFAARKTPAGARAFTRKKRSFDRLVRAFSWELALIDVDPDEALAEAQEISLRASRPPSAG